MVDPDDARISDETLIGRTAAGDPAAFGRLVRRHQAAVYRFAQAAAPDGEAEAVLCEAFRTAWRVAPRYRDEPSARPWLFALARQAIERRHLRAYREADFTPLSELARAAGWGDPTVPPAEGQAVEAAFVALLPEDREILTLCDREYFTVNEAARVTDRTETAVRTLLHRARLRLMARLRENTVEALADGERIVAGLHCGEVLADLTEHLDGRLGRERAQGIGEHLEGCERCRRFADEIAAAVCALRELPDAPLDPAIESRLLAGLEIADA
ncbi:MAG TPA: sigma-70 family RNA polymerase sigma factor [Thermoanaerobaculia bacterium]|jgi:RNA polymerase sigma-70 factor (ECF subfamily)